MNPKSEVDLNANLGDMFSAIKDNISDLYNYLGILLGNMQDIELVKGTKGRFLRIGMTCKYVMSEFIIEELAPKSYYIIDNIPEGCTPALSINNIAITSNAQLSESLLVRADRASNNMLLINMASNPVTNIKLLNSSYDFVISSDHYDIPDQFDANAPQWDAIPNTPDSGVVAEPTPSWTEFNDEGWSGYVDDNDNDTTEG